MKQNNPTLAPDTCCVKPLLLITARTRSSVLFIHDDERLGGTNVAEATNGLGDEAFVSYI